MPFCIPAFARLIELLPSHLGHENALPVSQQVFSLDDILFRLKTEKFKRFLEEVSD